MAADTIVQKAFLPVYDAVKHGQIFTQAGLQEFRVQVLKQLIGPDYEAVGLRVIAPEQLAYEAFKQHGDKG